MKPTPVQAPRTGPTLLKEDERMKTALAHRSLVALTPQEVGGAQAELMSWCSAKILELSRELADARQNLRQAKAMLWRWQGWQKVATKTAKRMVYYAKIKAAIQAGYLIVPNLPVDVIAVRVKNALPRGKVHYSEGRVGVARPELLPAGVGRYVDDRLVVDDLSFQDKDNKKVERYVASGFDEEIDFPTTAVKPVVLAATQRAMALRIFDRVGVVRDQSWGQRGDPIVVGQLLDPMQPWSFWENEPRKVVTFFIAWWLDTRAL